MHSRLYTRVLNQFPWMVNCTAISSLYNDTGIFSIFASAESAQADEMVNVLCKELQVYPPHAAGAFCSTGSSVWLHK